MAVRPHFAHPFRVVGKSVATVEQDSQHEIETNVRAILSTRVGSRIESPEFGIPDELFSLQPPPQNLDAVLAAAEEFEPRAQILGSPELEDLTRKVLIELAQTGD